MNSVIAVMIVLMAAVPANAGGRYYPRYHSWDVVPTCGVSCYGYYGGSRHLSDPPSQTQAWLERIQQDQSRQRRELGLPCTPVSESSDVCREITR